MKALERLSLPGKFSLLALLCLALIAAPTSLYVLGALRLCKSLAACNPYRSCSSLFN
jgi:hypothetical protein